MKIIARSHCKESLQGRWSEEAASFVLLARARARELPLPFRSTTAAAFVACWSAFLSLRLSCPSPSLSSRVASGCGGAGPDLSELPRHPSAVMVLGPPPLHWPTPPLTATLNCAYILVPGTPP